MLGKRVKWENSIRIVRHGFLLMLLLWGTVEVGYGQDQVRKYATNQQVNAGLATSVVNPERAVDENPRTYSTINRLLGVGSLITVTQYLEFSYNQPAGTPVTLKLTFPSGILSILGGVEIQPFNNLRNDLSTLYRWQADAVGKAYTDSDLLGLLDGAGDMEITIVPQNVGGTSLSYRGVWVRLQGVAVGQSLDLFHAYVLESSSVSCADRDKSIDVLSGVRAGTVVGGIANATGEVINSWGMVDGSGPTTLNVGVQLLSEVFHTTIFSTPSRPHQIVKIIFEDPGGGLLDLGLLTGLKIQPYLGNTAVGLPLNESTLLSLRLLPGSSGIAELTVPVAGSFDRIEISMGGVAGALESLTLHEVSRTFGPLIYPEAELLNKLTECEEVDLKDAILNYDPVAYSYNYYTTSIGGTPQGSIVSESGTYYIEVTENVTGCVSERVEVVANVLPLPGKPHLTISDVIN